jgi:hypothetical protein
LASPCDGAGAGAVGAAGIAGFGDVEPEPVVLGVLIGALLVAVGDEPVLAVLLLLFQPAMIRNPISSRTATPAIQPHIPPAALSSRRRTGSLSRGSLYRGSVKRGSVMTFSFHSTYFFRVEWKKPAGYAGGSFNKRVKYGTRAQATFTAARHAAHSTKKNRLRNTGRLVAGDQISTARPAA